METLGEFFNERKFPKQETVTSEEITASIVGEKWHKFIPSLLWRVGTEHKTALLSSHLTSSTSSPVGWSKIFHLIYWLPSLVGWNEIFHVIHWVPQSHCALCSKFRFQQFRPAGSAWLPNSPGNSMEFCAIPWNSVQFLGTITPRGPAADCTQKPQIHKSAPAPEPSWELNT